MIKVDKKGDVLIMKGMSIPNIMLVKAIRTAVDMHGTQTDKSGNLYVEHPLAVMERMHRKGNGHKIVAVLHDVLEDTSCSVEDLNFLPQELIDTISLLTKFSSEETYGHYIDRILNSGNEMAIEVKLADLSHNYYRLAFLKDEKTRKRLHKKYAPAIKKLLREDEKE
jgi:(p)ppGpp synthase/HD superfamily hydrolase